MRVDSFLFRSQRRRRCIIGERALARNVHRLALSGIYVCKGKLQSFRADVVFIRRSFDKSFEDDVETAVLLGLCLGIRRAVIGLVEDRDGLKCQDRRSDLQAAERVADLTLIRALSLCYDKGYAIATCVIGLAVHGFGSVLEVLIVVLHGIAAGYESRLQVTVSGVLRRTRLVVRRLPHHLDILDRDAEGDVVIVGNAQRVGVRIGILRDHCAVGSQTGQEEIPADILDSDLDLAILHIGSEGHAHVVKAREIARVCL